MSPILNCIKNKNTTTKPIWLMRQAGRYLPEFREIRSKNPDFIKLCLNTNLAQEITLQPLKRFKFDAAIIFSDILMLPYGLDQDIKFRKNFGPILGDLNIKNLNKVSDVEFSNKLKPVYKTLKKISKNKLIKENPQSNVYIDSLISPSYTSALAQVIQLSSISGRKNNLILLGDLSLYHDMNGLLAASRYDFKATILVVNNNGGGIFNSKLVKEGD